MSYILVCNNLSSITSTERLYKMRSGLMKVYEQEKADLYDENGMNVTECHVYHDQCENKFIYNEMERDKSLLFYWKLNPVDKYDMNTLLMISNLQTTHEMPMAYAMFLYDMLFFQLKDFQPTLNLMNNLVQRMFPKNINDNR